MDGEGRAGRVLKRLLVGRPIATYHELHHRLSKRVALAVFSSDALSSSAYATDEILLALAAAGSGALRLSIPVAAAVVGVLGVVVVSYRQTVKAYPSGGGAYIVAKDNFGEFPGLLAASALFIDYVLTVSVSVAAGVAAIVAAFPHLEGHRVGMGLGVVALITLMNLRGLRESGRIFAVPTYGFLLAMGATIVTGAWQVVTGTSSPLPPPSVPPEQALGLFLVLRAFASGSTALTGVEAISNGVPVFRPPESKNAAATLLILGILLAGLFAGITFLANALHVDPGAIEHGKTVPSQIARAVFGGGSPLFFAVQAFTAMILFLAANTSYADFPRLAAILAKDRYLPRVLKHRGDKLAFSNGIVILALAASALLAHYRAEVHRIIPLYVIGVFTSFTLSQSGMVAHWFRLRAPGWRRSALVNGIGACTTFIVLIVVAATKFRLGAWQVVVMIPVLAWILGVVGRHYRQVAEELRLSDEVERIEANKVVILGSPFPAATTKALAFARAFSPRELHVLAFRLSERSLKGTRQHWKALGVKAPIEATGPRLGDLVEYVRGLQPSASEPVMVALPDAQFHNPLRQIRAGRLLIRIK
ncbi:MAG: APC family permease, partial [Actinomycetota bacterium]